MYQVSVITPFHNVDMGMFEKCAESPGVPYQLVVTNSAGLYRYVTDHIVSIQETEMDKVLFKIY
jgi:hypothetical protein